jgi:hypothetical protein
MTPPPAQCTTYASRMMTRMTTTSQKKNTTIPGMTYPATLLGLATASSYPAPPGLSATGAARPPPIGVLLALLDAPHLPPQGRPWRGVLRGRISVGRRTPDKGDFGTR